MPTPPVILVTRADREPYLSLAKTLHDEIRRHGIPCAIDLRDYGGYSGQYKRHVISEAVMANPGATVYWLDSDTRLKNTAQFLSLLIARPTGIHSADPWHSLSQHIALCYAHSPAGPYLARLKTAGRIPPEAVLCSDPFAGYALTRPQADRFFAEWDRITAELRADGVDVSDGVSVGIAASAAKIPIYNSIPLEAFAASVQHLFQQMKAHPHTWRWRGGKGTP